jgi:hypothetical protein
MLLYIWPEPAAEAKVLPIFINHEVYLDTWLNDHLHIVPAMARAADLRVEQSSDGRERSSPGAVAESVIRQSVRKRCKYSEPGTPITLRLATEQTVLLAVEMPVMASRRRPAASLQDRYRTEAARGLGRPGFGLGLAGRGANCRGFGGAIHVERPS